MTLYSSRGISSGQMAPVSGLSKADTRLRSRPQTAAYIYGPPVDSAPRRRPTTQESVARSTLTPLQYNASVVRMLGVEGHRASNKNAELGTYSAAAQRPLYSSSISGSRSSSGLSKGRGLATPSIPSSAPTASRRRVRFQCPETKPPHKDALGREPIQRNPSVNHFHVQRSLAFHMHPLFSQSRDLNKAPISYDVTYKPSSRTVLDRSTNASVPMHTLSQPATDPPITALATLILRSDNLPWPVVVVPPNCTYIPQAGYGCYTVTSSPPRSKMNSAAITNLDVLNAVHRTLSMNVTVEEWNSLGNGSPLQRRVAEAYEQRCTRMGGGWEGGVKRIDWLGGNTRLVGVKVEKNPAGARIGKLVFGKA